MSKVWSKGKQTVREECRQKENLSLTSKQNTKAQVWLTDVDTKSLRVVSDSPLPVTLHIQSAEQIILALTCNKSRRWPHLTTLVQITAISHLGYFMGSWRNSQCLALSPLTLKRPVTRGLAEMFNHTMSLFCPRPSDSSLRGRAKSLLMHCRPGSAWVRLTSSPAPHYLCSLVWASGLPRPHRTRPALLHFKAPHLLFPLSGSCFPRHLHLFPYFLWPLPSVPISTRHSLITIFRNATLPKHSLFSPSCFIILHSTNPHLTCYTFYSFPLFIGSLS